jgi:hypothetical protein
MLLSLWYSFCLFLSEGVVAVGTDCYLMLDARDSTKEHWGNICHSLGLGHDAFLVRCTEAGAERELGPRLCAAGGCAVHASWRGHEPFAMGVRRLGCIGILLQQRLWLNENSTRSQDLTDESVTLYHQCML